MREIKFRVWDTTSKRMYSPSEIGGIDLFQLERGDTEFTRFMQYTGLKDKNGMEIYEGDIVEQAQYVFVDLPRLKNWVILWGSWSWMKGRALGEPRFSFDAIEARTSSQVIGNIYENPELVKTTTAPKPTNINEDDPREDR